AYTAITAASSARYRSSAHTFCRVSGRLANANSSDPIVFIASFPVPAGSPRARPRGRLEHRRRGSLPGVSSTAATVHRPRTAPRPPPPWTPQNDGGAAPTKGGAASPAPTVAREGISHPPECTDIPRTPRARSGGFGRHARAALSASHAPARA